MESVYSLFVPHPPIIVEEIGGPHIQEVRRTRDALFKLARELASDPPDTVIISSPHTRGGVGCVGALTGPKLTGSFSNFGCPALAYEFENDSVLLEELIAAPGIADNLGPFRESTLDHGSLVFLDFLAREGYTPRIVALSAVWGDLNLYWDFGKALGKLLRARGGRYVYVASGDLSHCTRTGPGRAGCKEGPEFDRKVAEALGNNEPQILLELNEMFIERAQQCGLCSFLIGLGVMEAVAAKGEVLSYEDPFGVGYLVGSVRART